MTILIDTSFMLAVAWKGDVNHPVARAAMREITEDRTISSAVLPELFYMLATRTNYNAAVRVFHTLQSNSFHIQGITAADMVRMEQIMLQYQDNRFDYVDVSIMALAERLNIADIYTFDRRDFAAFRPLHRAYLRLLP